MNNLIQELAEQVRATVPQGLDVSEWIVIYNRRLGESIVRICADVAQTAEPYQAADLIRKHFGVEE